MYYALLGVYFVTGILAGGGLIMVSVLPGKGTLNENGRKGVRFRG